MCKYPFSSTLRHTLYCRHSIFSHKTFLALFMFMILKIVWENFPTLCAWAFERNILRSDGGSENCLRSWKLLIAFRDLIFSFCMWRTKLMKLTNRQKLKINRSVINFWTLTKPITMLSCKPLKNDTVSGNFGRF